MSSSARPDRPKARLRHPGASRTRSRVWPRPFTGGSCPSRAPFTPVRYGCLEMGTVVKRRSMRAALAVGGCGCIFANIAVAAGAYGASPVERSGTPNQILTSAIASAKKAGSVRVTVHFFSGQTTGELVQDSARASAEQTVAIGKERVSIVLSKGTVYFSGNTQGLVNYFGLTKAVATTLADRWISASSSDSAFPSLVAGLTLSSALKEVSPTGSVVKGKRRTVDGQTTTSLSGTGPAGVARVTLFVAAHGKSLPVEAVGSGGSAKKASGEIVTFSRWGEAVHVPVPSESIPISTLNAGTPIRS